MASYLWQSLVLLLGVSVHSVDLRNDGLESCVYIGSYVTSRTTPSVRPLRVPLTLEWTYNTSTLQGRLISSAVRAGYSIRDGFVGIGFKGDGDANPNDRDNLLAAWPDEDIDCVKLLYMNTTTQFMGRCGDDNATLAMPNCTYAAEIGHNGTCRDENTTIPTVCHCICNPYDGCWGPEPSCPGCQDGCNGCAAGYGGSSCRIPVSSDIYLPDGNTMNTLIRLSFLRNLEAYGHTIVPGVPNLVDVVWAYRQGSLFHPTDARCADGIQPGLYENSPYVMVNRDTERVQIPVDWSDAQYKRKEDGTCVSAPLQAIPGKKPIQHVRLQQGSPELGISWVSQALKLGAYSEYIPVTSSMLMDESFLYTEASFEPEPEVQTITGAVTSSLTWTAQSSVANGWWGGTNSGNKQVHYIALVIYAATNLVTTMTYDPPDSTRAWMDGKLWLVSDSAKNGVVSDPFVITQGWHQLMFKIYDADDSQGLRFQFNTSASLEWKYSMDSADRYPMESGYVDSALYLGPIDIGASDDIHNVTLNPFQDKDLQPDVGDDVSYPVGLNPPATWQSVTAPSGNWGYLSVDHFVQYYALAIYSDTELTATIIYRNDEWVRGWMDGTLILSKDEWDNGVEQLTSPFTITEGWHQFLFKLRDVDGTSTFKWKVDVGSQLKWQYQLPLKCSENPCLNGGTCINSECHCSDLYSGQYCEVSYLWGEQFQNMRMVMLLME